MADSATPTDTLVDLEARHDDLLRRLADLDSEVERVLRTCQGCRAASPDTLTAE